MKLVVATPPPKLQNKKLYQVSLVYALLIVVCMLAQLFRFDTVLDVATQQNMFGGSFGVTFWTVLEVMQLFALPFLLRLQVSPLLRLMSFVAAAIVPLFWVAIAGWQLSTSTTSLGIFGTELSSANHWWITAVATIIAVAGVSASVACMGSYRQLREALSK